MNRVHRPHSSARAGTILLAIAAGLAMALPPAHAGLRDKIKSVKDKAIPGVQKPGASAAQPGAPPAFDDRTLELTDARLGQVLKGLKAAAAATADRPALIARRDRLHREIDDLQNKHGEKIGDYVTARDLASQCLSEGIAEARRKGFDALVQRGMVDPNSLREIAELSVRANEAQMQGDSAAIRKTNAALEKFSAPTREDTLAARKECGPGPAPFAPALRLTAAQAEHGETFEQIRAMDFKSTAARTKDSGLTEDQMAIAIDRITLYLAAVKRGSDPSGFTDVELQALATHKDALAAALGV